MEDASQEVLGRQVKRLRRVDVCQRWLFVALLWLTVGAWSFWEMREGMALLWEYFSFTGLKYIVVFHIWGGGAGFILCLTVTLSSIFWQIGHSLWRLSPRERHHLEVRVRQIQERGSKHPYWRWIQVR
jgi:hypothetical protein